VDLIETVGARLVILGSREFEGAMAGAQKAMTALGASAKTVATSSETMTKATIDNEAATKTLAAAMRTAVTAHGGGQGLGGGGLRRLSRTWAPTSPVTSPGAASPLVASAASGNVR